MRIAVNTRLLLPGKLEGIGWFTLETLKRITSQHPEHEFFFLFDRHYAKEFIFSENITPLVSGPPSRHPFLWYLWFEWTIPSLLKRCDADVFLSPDGYLSLRSNTPSVTVMHDINFEHYPKDLPFFYRKYYQHYFPRYAQKSDRIATVSEYSKQDIAKHYQVSPDKIDVVYNGVNESYEPADEQTIRNTRLSFTHGEPYFLFVGALHRRKNITNLFKAFDLFCQQSDSTIKLLIVGEKKWWTTEMQDAYRQMKHSDRIIFAGRLGPEVLKNVIASALAMVYVSYFEGFGIPIVEGMMCDVPVITSNITSMPEVAGDAALLVDPFSIESIADAMTQITRDKELRHTLVEKGKIQRQRFSWQQTADRLWKSIEQVI